MKTVASFFKVSKRWINQNVIFRFIKCTINYVVSDTDYFRGKGTPPKKRTSRFSKQVNKCISNNWPNMDAFWEFTMINAIGYCTSAFDPHWVTLIYGGLVSYLLKMLLCGGHDLTPWTYGVTRYIRLVELTVVINSSDSMLFN